MKVAASGGYAIHHMIEPVMENPLVPAPETTTAIATVSFNSSPVLKSFLLSVKDASSSETPVVVADNAALDQKVAAICASAGADYLALDRNYGYGGAMNRAVRIIPANFEWILICNPDVVLHRGAIDRLVSAGQADSRVGCVGPAILTDGAVYPSARSIPSIRTGVGHALFANIWLGNPWTKAYRHDSSPTPVRRDTGWLSGACLLVRRSAFDELGGFDDEYFMYFEDVDFGYRLGKAGYRNVYEPHAVVTHSGAHSTDQDASHMIQIHHESARRFVTRKYAAWYLWPVRVALGIGLDLRSALLKRRATHH